MHDVGDKLTHLTLIVSGSVVASLPPLASTSHTDATGRRHTTAGGGAATARHLRHTLWSHVTLEPGDVLGEAVITKLPPRCVLPHAVVEAATRTATADGVLDVGSSTKTLRTVGPTGSRLVVCLDGLPSAGDMLAVNLPGTNAGGNRVDTAIVADPDAEHSLVHDTAAVAGPQGCSVVRISGSLLRATLSAAVESDVAHAMAVAASRSTHRVVSGRLADTPSKAKSPANVQSSAASKRSNAASDAAWLRRRAIQSYVLGSVVVVTCVVIHTQPDVCVSRLIDALSVPPQHRRAVVLDSAVAACAACGMLRGIFGDSVPLTLWSRLAAVARFHHTNAETVLCYEVQAHSHSPYKPWKHQPHCPPCLHTRSLECLMAGMWCCVAT